MRALRAEGLSRPGLEPTTLELRAGECVAIVGPSGAGKSLLLRAIADLDPNEGEVYLNAKPRSAMSGPHWRRQVVYVSAESAWWADNVDEHMPDRDGAAELLPALGLPVAALSWSVKRLSTGEKQRLALARALSLNPPVLLADEPTAALDETTTQAVEALLRQRLKRGMAMVLITHTRAQAERLADRTLIMDCGCLTDP